MRIILKLRKNLVLKSILKIDIKMLNTKTTLDSRMTEESKKFISKFSKLMDRKIFKEMSLNDARSLIEASTLMLNKKVLCQNVNEKEYFVKNDHDGFEIPVTAYIPIDVKAQSPLVIYCHGGGWTICSRKTHHHAIKNLAQKSNCIWLSVEYRLSPEYKFPVCLEDCKSVVRWLNENKSKIFNSNSNAKIGIAGDSAGGTISASIGHELKNLIDFQILIYACVQFEMAFDSYKEFQSEQYLLTPALLKFFTLNLINNFDEIRSPRLAPILNENFEDLPKSLIIGAELDPLVDDSKEYHKKLVATGNESELYVIKGVQHGFFNLPGVLPNAFNESSAYIVNFLNKILNDKHSAKL